MATLVCFHAHPDDESMATGGIMAKAAEAGHRVVLVTATRGELGEIVPGVLAEGEQLALRRSAELYESAEILGVARVEVLGYVDSGMMGTAGNDAPWAFWQADVDAAARRLAVVLAEERPDVLTIYDDHGGYGHPDHIQVHRVGARAAELAGIDAVYQSTINRDHILRLMAQREELGVTDLPDEAAAEDGAARVADDPSFGSPESVITHLADVREHAGTKRRSLRAHRSQVGDDFFLLQLPDEAYAAAMGLEWFIGPPGTPPAGSLAAALFAPYEPPFVP
jgi:LmbE family N-acetylglucosaminyl deacetylase